MNAFKRWLFNRRIRQAVRTINAARMTTDPWPDHHKIHVHLDVAEDSLRCAAAEMNGHPKARSWLDLTAI